MGYHEVTERDLSLLINRYGINSLEGNYLEFLSHIRDISSFLLTSDLLEESFKCLNYEPMKVTFEPHGVDPDIFYNNEYYVALRYYFRQEDYNRGFVADVSYSKLFNLILSLT